MPIRRIYARRPTRKPRRRSVATGRFLRRPRVTRSLAIQNAPHYFKRRFNKGTLTLNNLAEVFQAYTFKLSDLPNYTEFTNLFDRYRICKVAVHLIPQWTNSDLNPVTTTERVNPAIYSVVDTTEDAAPTSLNEMYEYSNCKITRGGRIHKRYFTPSVLTSAFESGASTAYIPKFKQWLTTDDPATPHYCMKIAADKTSTSSNNFTIRVMMTYYLQCKNIK